MTKSNLKKIKLLVDDDVETLWAELVTPGQYRLMSIPFLAYNVSWGDVIATELDGQKMPVAQKVLKKSGNRTIRILLPDDIDNKMLKDLYQWFEKAGCGVEGFEPSLLAVNIPSEVDLDNITDYCDKQELRWEYGDPQPDVPQW